MPSAAISLALAAALAWPHWREFMTDGFCLDRGDSYDYSQHWCDFEISHAYAPRHEQASASLATSIGFAALGVLLLLRLRLAARQVKYAFMRTAVRAFEVF